MRVTVRQHDGKAMRTTPVSKRGGGSVYYCYDKMRRGQCVLLLWQNEEGAVCITVMTKWGEGNTVEMKWNDSQSSVMVTVEQECEKWRKTQDAT